MSSRLGKRRRSELRRRHYGVVLLASIRAAQRLVGDVRGRQFTSCRRARGQPARTPVVLLGSRSAPPRPQNTPSGVLVPPPARGAPVEISSVPLMSGERVACVFGPFEERPDDRPTAPHPHLTPRQVEVLRLLVQGRSTKQIAAELHLSTETVRNHIRRLFVPSASTPDSKPSPSPGPHRPTKRTEAS